MSEEFVLVWFMRVLFNFYCQHIVCWSSLSFLCDALSRAPRICRKCFSDWTHTAASQLNTKCENRWFQNEREIFSVFVSRSSNNNKEPRVVNLWKRVKSSRFSLYFPLFYRSMLSRSRTCHDVQFLFYMRNKYLALDYYKLCLSWCLCLWLSMHYDALRM